MVDAPQPHSPPGSTRTLWWVARIGALAVVLLLMAMVTGGEGSPTGVREYLYLALFPFGFSIAYLIGWVRPLLGGALSVACMLLSQVAAGATYGVQAYVIWGVLTLPGLLYLWVGLQLRKARDGSAG